MKLTIPVTALPSASVFAFILVMVSTELILIVLPPLGWVTVTFEFPAAYGNITRIKSS